MIDLSGKKFGKLIVIRMDGYVSNGNGQRLIAWACLCECGNETRIGGYRLTSGRVKNCIRCGYKKSAKSQTTHGMTNTRIFKVWQNIRRRCSKKATGKDIEWYYKKNIRVCDEWQSFSNFYAWAKDRWEPGLQIDRINNSNNYCPENCRFTTNKINSQNKSNSKYWFIYGKRFESCSDASNFWDIDQATIHQMCHGRHRWGKFYPPEQLCYTVRRYP